jgi:post-segregation antitoxin (ccd killing protein)
MAMVETENRMAPLNVTVDLERQNKLRTAALTTNISMSELVRYMIDQLEKDLGRLDNPDPAAVAELKTYCEQKGLTKGTVPRGRRPLAVRS